MPRTATLLIRIEPNLKRKSEKLFAKLGITASDAVALFLKQSLYANGLPFPVNVPSRKFPTAGSVTCAENFDDESDSNLEI